MRVAGNVLICDGDPRRRLQLAYWLNEDGHEVVLTGTAAEALARLAEGDFACVLLDLLLPGISGLDVLPVIHSCYPRLPVIALAGENSLDLERRARVERVFYYLAESVNRDELRSVVASATRQASGVGRVAAVKREMGGYARDSGL
jgi:DNA-binding NtrC family response regulator